jgi:hypothetical protein
MNVLLLFLFGCLLFGLCVKGQVRPWHLRSILVATMVLSASYLSLRFV